MTRTSTGRIVALAFVALLVLNGLTLNVLKKESGQERARQDASAAARKAVAQIFTYGPSDINQYPTRALRMTTGRFGKELKTVIDKQIKVEAKRNSTTIRTTVEAAAPVSTTSTRAVVVVFADQWRTDRRSQTPTLNAVRIKVTMRATNQGWRVAGLRAF